MSKGWTTVTAASGATAAKAKPRRNKKKATAASAAAAELVDVPWQEWAEEWSPDERTIFIVLRESKAGAMTALQLAAELNKRSAVADNTKESVGQLLYDGALAAYVVREGEAPNRKWRIKRQ